MKIINDGKWSVFRIKVFKIIYELDFWITGDCTNSLSNYAIFIYRKWGHKKLLKSKTFKLLKLRYK